MTQIYVKSPFGSVLTIEADIHCKHGTSYLKDLLQRNYHIPCHHQQLFFCGKPLVEDECTLDEYGIEDQDTLFISYSLLGGMLPIRVEILGNEQKSVKINVRINDTIRDAKRMIQHELGIPPDEQHLVHCGIPLDDDRVISSYELKTNTLLHVMIMDRRDNFTISVVNFNCQKMAFSVSSRTTVKYMKESIEERMSIGRNEQCLIYIDKQLEDNKTLSDYGIKNGSILYVLSMSTPADVKNVTIKDPNQKAIHFIVTLRTTVKMLKRMIEDRLGFSSTEQTLVTDGKQLEDEKLTMANYGIEDLCEIVMCMRLKGGVE